MGVVFPTLRKIEKVLEKEEDPLKAEEITKGEIKKLREQIVSMLNKSGEVKNIVDLFKEPPPFVHFNPIVFEIRLPISLQKVAYLLEPNRAEVESFFVVFDGEIVVVSAVCSVEERPWGVYDVRDRLRTMLKIVVPDLEETPPCLTHQAIAIVHKPDEVKKAPNDVYVQWRPKDKLVDTLRNLYASLTPDIQLFYYACSTCQETGDVADKTNEGQTKMLSYLKEFMKTTWMHPLKRKGIVGKSRICAVDILANLSEYSSLRSELKKQRAGIEERRAHRNLFDELMKKVNLDEYAEPETLDTESLIRVIEHARSETETYSSFVSTFVSTLVGAIIGSALTILISYLCGFL